MDKHLKEKGIEHLQMKVNTIENELIMVKQNNKTELNKVREEYERTLKQIKEENKTQFECLKRKTNIFENELAVVKQSNNKDKLLLLLKSKNVYIGGIESGKKQNVEIQSFMTEGYGQFCMGNDIRFSETKQIGFDAKDINVIGNDIVFGLSKNKISATTVKSKICKTFNGN
eukprot:119840_1